MIRHAVMFRFAPETAPADVAAIVAGLVDLRAEIPEILDYRFGPDVGINEGNFDFAVVADFADAEDYLVYRDHPRHKALIAERITPHVAARAAVQFSLD